MFNQRSDKPFTLVLASACVGSLTLAVVLVGSCGAGNADYSGYSGADAGSGLPECFSSNECPTGWTCSEFGTCVPPAQPGTDGGVEPEEVELEFSPPVSSERYVYVAMSELDALAKIDGNTLEVTSIAVGDQPKVLAGIPGSDGVVVLDQSNGTATIVRPSGATNDTRTVPTLSNMNQIDVDPSGRFAVTWFDLNKAALESGGLGGVTAIGSFQDVTVIRLEQDDELAVDMTVGFRPRDIQFDDSGDLAFVITEEGVSRIDLAAVTSGGPGIVAPIPVTSDPLADPNNMEVLVSSTGDRALVRETGQAEVRIVSLSGPTAGDITVLDLPAVPTDLDLSLDGLTGYAVLRDTSQLAIIDIGAAPGEELTLVGLGAEMVGSLVLAPTGGKGLLFTNASESERVTVVDLQSPGYPRATYPLQKSVRAIGFEPGGETALILHAKAFGDPQENGITFDEFIDRSHGYSIFDMETGFDKLQLTSVEARSFAFSTTTPRGYVLLDGGDTPGATAEAHVLELDTGVVRVQAMSSPPESVGVLPAAGMAFINQRHSLGRVSFLNLQTDAMRTVTGFDLNSRIVD